MNILQVPSLSSEHHLGIADLLPPSPAPVYSASRSFMPSPSALSTSSASTHDQNTSSKDGPRPSAPPASSAPSSATGVSPFPLDNPGLLSSISFDTPIPPLNFGELIANPEYAHLQLEKTMDDLSHLLSVIEDG